MKKNLKLSNKKLKMEIQFGADQTPTPTRFMRNCEEVGLFQDLQVNPFEETFKRAVEYGKSSSTSLEKCQPSAHFSTEDTLHTPHIFPNMENEIESEVASSSNFVTVIENDQPEEKAESTEAVVREGPRSLFKPIAPKVVLKPRQQVPILLQMPDGRILQIHGTALETNNSQQNNNDLLAQGASASMNIGIVPLVNKTSNSNCDADISPMIRQKLRARIENTANKRKEGVATAIKFKELTSKALQPSTTAATLDKTFDAERRKRFLEQNRAAAMRCREKRKVFVSNLEKQVNVLSDQYNQLQFELRAVQAENRQLKAILLNHKDCSVTQSLNNNNMWPMGIDPQLLRPKPDSNAAIRINGEGRQFSFLRKDFAKPQNDERQPNVIRPPQEVINVKTLSLANVSPKKEKKNELILVGTDAYLSSTVMPNESELETFQPTVIQVNPNKTAMQFSSASIGFVNESQDYGI